METTPWKYTNTYGGPNYDKATPGARRLVTIAQSLIERFAVAYKPKPRRGAYRPWMGGLSRRADISAW